MMSDFVSTMVKQDVGALGVEQRRADEGETRTDSGI